MVSNLRLVDPSTATNPQFPEGLEMLAFSVEQRHLPTLRRPGDIIRLHRVTVRTDSAETAVQRLIPSGVRFGFVDVAGLQVSQYNGKPQLIAKIHRAKECSFCLFDGRPEVCSVLVYFACPSLLYFEATCCTSCSAGEQYTISGKLRYLHSGSKGSWDHLSLAQLWKASCQHSTRLHSLFEAHQRHTCWRIL